MNAARDALRATERAKVLYRHPRCVVCDDPITQRPGRNHRSRTCSKRSCAVARYNWLREPVSHKGRICAECRGAIPADRNANSLYCSRRCNSRRNGRINTRRFRQRAA